MTAMLKNIRELDARLKRGELTPDQYARRREALLQSVEVIETVYEPTAPSSNKRSTTDEEHPASLNAIGFSFVVCFAVMGVSIALILLFLPDLNLALTLGVTLLAALSVALFRALDD